MPSSVGLILARGFEFNTGMTPALVAGFAPDAFPRRFEGAQCAHWLLGHVAHSRRQLGRLLGVAGPLDGWEDWFGMHSSGQPDDAWPGVEEVLADLQSIGGVLAEAIGALPEEKLAEEVDYILDGRKVPLARNVQFLFFHDSYHVGQIGYIRSLLGLPYLA